MIKIIRTAALAAIVGLGALTAIPPPAPKHPTPRFPSASLRPTAPSASSSAIPARAYHRSERRHYQRRPSAPTDMPSTRLGDMGLRNVRIARSSRRSVEVSGWSHRLRPTPPSFLGVRHTARSSPAISRRQHSSADRKRRRSESPALSRSAAVTAGFRSVTLTWTVVGVFAGLESAPRGILGRHPHRHLRRTHRVGVRWRADCSLIDITLPSLNARPPRPASRPSISRSRPRSCAHLRARPPGSSLGHHDAAALVDPRASTDQVQHLADALDVAQTRTVSVLETW